MTRWSVSIALATFNGASFIEQQLASLACQTRLPDEVVVTDDRSTDDTVKIVRRFSKTAPFSMVIVENEDRLGYSRNFMKALSLCKGDVIAFCDQDDIWYERKLQACCQVLEQSSALLVHHNANVVTENGRSVGRLLRKSSPLIDPNRPWSCAPGFTQVFSRDLVTYLDLKQHLLPSDAGMIAHDVILFFIAACLGRVKFIDSNLADYRQHDSNVYGWSKHVSLKRKLRHALERRANLYRVCTKQASSRVDLLSSIACRRLNETDSAAFKRQGTIWKKTEEIYLERSRVYGDSKLINRIKSLARLLEAGVYRPKSRWGLGPMVFLSDAVLGCVLGRFFEIYGLNVSIPDLALQNRSGQHTVTV